MFKFIQKQLKNKKGFTLVELVVVIAILGILAAIAIPKLGSSRDSALKATHNANVRILKSAAAMYLADNPTAKNVVLLGTGAEKDGDGEGAKDILLKYLDSEEAPKAYDNSDFTVKITESGDIDVQPGELEELE